MEHPNYCCAKCQNRSYSTGEIRAAGGFWTKIFDIQSEKYTAVTCTQCGYTEFYKRDGSTIENVFDFFTN